jgi:ABC-type methionine transport system permease subunit
MGEQRYSMGIRWILYLISFFGGGWLGLVIGIFLMTREDEESKQVGKNCLIAWLLSFVIGCVCVLCLVILQVMLAAGGAASSAMLLPVI